MNRRGRPPKNASDNMAKRLHVYADEKTCKSIREKCEQEGISINDYLIENALNFNVNDIPQKLENVLIKTGGTDNDKIRRKESRRYFVAEKNKSEFQSVDPIGTKQFHLRVTQETYEKIKQRAARFSMTVSDYIVFTTMHFDIMDISEKIDKINQKLDTLTKMQ